jgi:hypothetical protein
VSASSWRQGAIIVAVRWRSAQRAWGGELIRLATQRTKAACLLFCRSHLFSDDRDPVGANDINEERGGDKELILKLDASAAAMPVSTLGPLLCILLEERNLAKKEKI